jgi:hypothetical protein
VIEVINAKGKRLVWRGTARTAIAPDLTVLERNARIQDAVRQILDQFPPKK